MLRKTLLLAALLPGCAAMQPVVMPEGVTTKPSQWGSEPNKHVIDTISFEHTEAITSTLGKCAALSINNESARLSSDSTWVGPATGNIYNSTSSTTDQGGSVILHQDESGIVVKGREPYSVMSGIVRVQKVVQFKASAELLKQGYKIVFSDITQAQLSTGYMPNNGFNPNGVWGGAMPLELYTAIKGVDTRLHQCLTQ